MGDGVKELNSQFVWLWGNTMRQGESAEGCHYDDGFVLKVMKEIGE